MATLDKFIQMLNSPKLGIRYEACEELRVAGESSEAAIFALEKATHDSDHEVADAARRALSAEVHRQMLRKLGKPVTMTEAELRREEAAKALASIVIVTTPTIDGYKVTEYLGLVSAEVVLGTGFLSELGAGLADFLGVRADEFQAKLKQAKEAAIRELRTRAYELHANAVLGVDLDYSVLANNMLMVVANGTAVWTEPIGAKTPAA